MNYSNELQGFTPAQRATYSDEQLLAFKVALKAKEDAQRKAEQEAGLIKMLSGPRPDITDWRVTSALVALWDEAQGR
jgi:hypothetical protein